MAESLMFTYSFANVWVELLQTLQVVSETQLTKAQASYLQEMGCLRVLKVES